MENQKIGPTTSEKKSEKKRWSQIMANCLWGCTFLIVLAFFWQSIGEILFK